MADEQTLSRSDSRLSMTSDIPPQSAPDETQAPSGTSRRPRPRGAAWVVAALYIFSGAVFASWLKGESNSHAADPPPQHQHSIHPTNG
jgi:hypothetical protein